MDVYYMTEKLETYLKNSKQLFRKIKNMKSVQMTMSRIRHLEIADNLLDFFESQPNCRIHSLKHDRKGEISIDAVSKISPIRLIFRENHGLDVFITIKDRETLAKITSITILELNLDHYK